MKPETILTWKWKPFDGYRSSYGPETVNTLRSMVARHYPHPHRFVCVTDDPRGLDPRVEAIPLWNDFANVPNPHDIIGGLRRPKNPSCYRRLRMFHPEIATVFGKRFVSMDLDSVITGDLTPLWDRPEDIVFWGDTNPRTHYNGSMVLMTAGARPQVWTDFDPKVSPQKSKAAGCFGSDQGWISYRLGPGEAKWSKADGVYSFRNDIIPKRLPLPGNAKVVFFHGRYDPWAHVVQQQYVWVREHYR